MKKFRTLRMTVFDSTNANFKINIESQFTSGSEQTGYRDRVYVTDKYTGILNCNIYLTFTYKGSDEAEPLYMSYPQIFRLRDTFKKVIDNGLLDGTAYTTIDGVLSVRPDHEDPYIISNIGKENNWIALKYAVATITNEDIAEPTPVVSIELSKNNHFASLLTVDEFLTVYAIICDINLPLLQTNMALAYLDTNDNAAVMPQVMQQPQAYYQPQYQQPMAPMPQVAQQQYQQQQRPVQRYTNYRANNGGQQASYRQTPPPPTTNRNSYQQQAPVQEKKPTNLPPRNNSAPIMNFNAVNETPVDDYSFDDTAALQAIFDEEE